MIGLVESTDVGAGRDDLVDAVEHVVGEGDVQAGKQVVELLLGPRAEECAGDAGVGEAEVWEAPIARTLPLRIRSESAESVSSKTVAGSGRWIW